jgi:hypothetical protein
MTWLVVRVGTLDALPARATMRTLYLTALLGWFASAAWSSVASADADPRAEMAAALVAQADLQPAPPVLPVAAVEPRHAAAGSAVKRGNDARGARNAARAAASAAEAANRVSGHAQAQAASQALAHQAQAAAAAAAGQAQSQAAKARATHPHPR